MNKKFSTLLSGFLLMSAFASAQTFQPADELKSGKSYFVVVDVDGIQGPTLGDLFLEAKDVDDNYSVKGVDFTPENKNLTWTFTESKFNTPEGTTYYYSLKNDEVGSYLKFDNNAVPTKATKVDGAYFKASAPAERYTNGTPLIYVANNQELKLVIDATGATLGEPGTNILFCEFAKNTLPANEATAERFNDVKGGSGFNLKFSSGNSNAWANDILTDLNLKAFVVTAPGIVWGNNNMFTIPAGVYFATEYPASLNNVNVIATREDFEACTFLAVNPDKNYDIHQADRGNGIGFDLMTISGADLNVYADQSDDRASVKGDVFVGNACFTIEVPDPLRAENAYNLKLANARVQTDASKNAHEDMQDLYIGSILDQNKNYLVTNEAAGALSFETTNSTLYDVTKLLKSEDAPSIYTIQFVSELYKNDNINFAGEKNHYLTVGVQDNGAGNNAFALHSVENYNAADPMFQFVITGVNKDEKTVTFANRQTKKQFTVSLYENEDGSFTVYEATGENLYVEKFDDLWWGNETHNGVIEFVNTTDNVSFYTLNSTKVILTPVTVEDKFATFVNRSDNDGLVTFELAKNVDDTPEFYVGARKNNGVIIPNRVLAGYANARNMTQFELEKVDSDLNTPLVDDPSWITNPYVYKNGSRILTSTVEDTVAYYKYRIKVFEELNGNGNPYYLDNTTMRLNATGWLNNQWIDVDPEEFIIKENIDGSVSLIPTRNVQNPEILDSEDLRYAEEGGNLQVNAANDAWWMGQNYDLASKLSVGLKTFMVEEDPAVSYEAIPQHVSFEAVRGGFMTKDENSDARLSISTQAAEDLTFWLDTVHSDRNVPSFYILKNGAYMFNAADSADYYEDRNNYRFQIENTQNAAPKLIFKTGELITSDTLRTTVDGRSVLVAEDDNAPKGIKGGLENFQFQIIQAEAGSDEYVIRQNGAYVCQLNNYFFLGNKDLALRFIIEKQSAPTANEGIEVSGVKVIAGNGQITIMGAAGKQVVVSNILGKVVASQTITSDNATIAVPAGIIAVAVEGEAAVKAIVK